MNVQQNWRLHDWISMGVQSGKIREVRTVVLAYRMDDCAVLRWIVDVVEGRMTEENVQVFMARVIQWNGSVSGETQPLS